MSKDLKNIYMENNKIFSDEYYTVDKTAVSIMEDLKICTESSILLDINSISVNIKIDGTGFSVKKNTSNMTTIGASLEMSRKHSGEIMALNFASATTPGGGYKNGTNAQEESLCRCSTLYPSLTKFNNFYIKNRMKLSPLYSHYLIYSPNTLVFRSDNFQLLDSPKIVSIITCPAVNRGVAKFIHSNKYIEKIMDERIEMIIKFIAFRKPKAVVLGAFGCGIFGNKREFIFSTFEKYINMYIDITKIDVVFAIPD